MFIAIMALWMVTVILIIATLALFMLNYCQRQRGRRVNHMRLDTSGSDVHPGHKQAYPYHMGNGHGPEMTESPDANGIDYNFAFPASTASGKDALQTAESDVNENARDSKATNF